MRTLLSLLTVLAIVVTPGVQAALSGYRVDPTPPVFIQPSGMVAKVPPVVSKVTPPTVASKVVLPVATPIVAKVVPIASPVMAKAAPVTTITVTDGAVLQNLPKFVRNLSNEDFKVWAAWQNSQSYLHKSKSNESPFLRGQRTVASLDVDMVGHRRGTHSLSSLAVSETYETQYKNTNYSGPGALTIFNPFCRGFNDDVAPNWAELYVPTTEGSCTMLEAMRKTGAVNPEKLFEKLMTPYFRDN